MCQGGSGRDVFPARAGMSPGSGNAMGDSTGVPRASGDEPADSGEGLETDACSPRERG